MPSANAAFVKIFITGSTWPPSLCLPLRQRRQDIPLLAEHFLTLYARRLGRPQLRLSAEALATLMDYPWPGNIRELENTLHNAVLLSKAPLITPQQLRLSAEMASLPPQGMLRWTAFFASSWRVTMAPSTSG